MNGDEYPSGVPGPDALPPSEGTHNGQPAPAAAPQHPESAVAAVAETLGNDTLADGEWHRLHPATPLLRGGIILLVVLGYVVANMRERLVSLFVGSDEMREYNGDPLDW